MEQGIKSYLESLWKILDLIYFDGPLLSYFRDNRGRHFLFFWYDIDEKYNRWYVVEITKKNLDKYMAGKIPLKKLMRSTKLAYSVDIDNDIDFYNIIEIENLEQIWQNISEDSFYSPDLANVSWL